METVIRSTCVYVLLLILLRLAGRRTLAQLTPFDLVLLLIISEATQTALTGNDTSLTTAFLAITTLLVLDLLLVMVKGRWQSVDRWVDGRPLVVVREGEPQEKLLAESRVDVHDVLTAARESQGLASMKQVRYAVLETNGHISIIPWEK